MSPAPRSSAEDDEAVRLVDRIIERHLANEGELVRALSKADRDRLARLLRRLLRDHEQRS